MLHALNGHWNFYVSSMISLLMFYTLFFTSLKVSVTCDKKLESQTSLFLFTKLVWRVEDPRKFGCNLQNKFIYFLNIIDLKTFTDVWT